MFTNCPLTGYQVINFKENAKVYSYEIGDLSNTFTLNICKGCFEKIQDFAHDKHFIFKGLFLNNKLPIRYDNIIHIDKSKQTDQYVPISLTEIYENSDFPKSQQAKLNHLFNYIFNHQKYDGEVIDYDFYSDYEKLFFKQRNELAFYVNSLFERGLLQRDNRGTFISFKGLSYYNEINEEGSLSNKCFVAMAFSDDMKAVRQSIKNALASSNFKDVFIDEQHINSDKTINDEILVNIKRSKFVIADFTHHRNGVYFESGFALGLGKKVIYTCS